MVGDKTGKGKRAEREKSSEGWGKNVRLGGGEKPQVGVGGLGSGKKRDGGSVGVKNLTEVGVKMALPWGRMRGEIPRRE